MNSKKMNHKKRRYERRKAEREAKAALEQNQPILTNGYDSGSNQGGNQPALSAANSEQPQINHGSGGNRRLENGLTPAENARLEGRAIRQGWIQVPFPTDVPLDKLRKEVEKRKDRSLREKALLSVSAGLESSSEKVRRIAERNAIAMEGKNLDAQRIEIGKTRIERISDNRRSIIERTEKAIAEVESSTVRGGTQEVVKTTTIVNRLIVYRIPDNGLVPNMPDEAIESSIDGSIEV